jgi:hypothetical protein
VSGIGDTLARPVGPMPLGAWLVVGAGGLYIAYRARNDGPKVTREVQQVPVPVGAIASEDQSPTVHVTPIIRIPSVPGSPEPIDTGGPVQVPITDVSPLPSLPSLPSFPTPPTAPAAPLPSPKLTTVLRPSGHVVTTNVNPHPYPTTPPPNGKRVVKDGSGREWVTAGSKPGVTGYVWNRNTGSWQAR